jgi:hypothetical protein
MDELIHERRMIRRKIDHIRNDKEDSINKERLKFEFFVNKKLRDDNDK